MFSVLRSRFSTAVVAMAVTALVLAGGAYAAKKYVITSTSQIKPSVLKSLQGKAGAQGPQGLPGANGKDGANGNAGKAGDQGPQGIQGIQGKQGIQGPEGSPWTAGGVLPSGKTETGSWGTIGIEGVTGLSFTIPLTAGLDSSHVIAEPAGYSGADEKCPGSAASPKAKAGFLCIYTGALIPQNATPLVSIFDPSAATLTIEGAALSGAALYVIGAEIATGTWAVTAS